jgi:cysteine desulfurase
MQRPIYLDYNATTPVDPTVLEALLPYLQGSYGNPSSSEHEYGWQAAQAVERARGQCARLIGAEPRSIIFTSGATESNNLALLGFLRHRRKELPEGSPAPHLITTSVEHKAVLDVAAHLKSEGFEVTLLPVDSEGRVHSEQVMAALQPNTAMVSIMFGQNEIGSINPIKDIGQALPDHVIFHVDAAQAAGRTPIDVDTMGIDLLSVSGHKIYGPKGVGYLYIRRGIEIEPLFFGGGQERGLRPGTLNTAGIVGLGTACEICQKEMPTEIERLTKLRDRFIDRVLSSVPSARLNGHRHERLISNASFSFSNLSSDVFALGLRGVAVSAGSACSLGQPSHVLASIGLPTPLARSTIRFGLGRFTTENDLDVAFEAILNMIQESERRQIHL